MLLVKKTNHLLDSSYYRNNEEKTYTVSPYLIKEFKNRWYVIGKTENRLRAFSIDRITDITLLKSKIEHYMSIEDLHEKIEETYGISFSNKAATSVKLRICQSQKPFIKSIPIHPKQTIIEENEDTFILKFLYAETLDLKQEILKYGAWVEVLEPKELRNWFSDEVNKMFQKYTKVI